MRSLSANKRLRLKCEQHISGTEGFHTNPDDCLPNPIVYPTYPEEPVTHPDSTEEEEKSYSKTESNTGQ